MDNEHFRSLLLKSSSNGAPPSSASSRPAALGSKKSGFMSMAPRTVRVSTAGADFAKQAAQRKVGAGAAGSKPKATTARGLKLGQGYQDRALQRLNTGKEDAREAQIKALGEKLAAGEMERDEYDRLRQEIAGGGEVETTHLVKGLDRKLLERVRKGEDVMNGTADTAKDAGVDEATAAVDEDFDDLVQQEVKAKEKEVAVKKGELADPPPIAGVKRSRNDILAELKAKRQAEMAAKQAARPELDASRFKSIQTRVEKPKVQLDSKGREVILTRDEHGRIKKKIRRTAENNAHGNTSPPRKFLDDGAATAPAPKIEATADKKDVEPDTMFEDVDDDYDPLGGLDGNDDDDDDDVDDDDTNDDSAGSASGAGDDEPKVAQVQPPTAKEHASADSDRQAIKDSSASARPRNYFSSSRDQSTDHGKTPKTELNPFQDPAFLSAISRAGNLAKFKMTMKDNSGDQDDVDAIASNTNPLSEDELTATDTEAQRAKQAVVEEQERLARKREQLLKNSTRDLDDMDLGFGGGRFDDDDDDEGGEGSKVRLSEWREGAGGGGESGGEDGKGGGHKGRAGEKRKRTRGKRKGDKNDAKDVLEVMRRQRDK